MQKRRKLGRGVAIVGAGMSKFAMFKDKDSKDLFTEAYKEMLASVDKGVDPADIDALYIGNFSNDYFAHQSHWGPIISDIIGHAPKPATRTEGACASSALALREGVFAIASGFYDMVLVGGVEDMSKENSSMHFFTSRCPLSELYSRAYKANQNPNEKALAGTATRRLVPRLTIGIVYRFYKIALCPQLSTPEIFQSAAGRGDSR